MTLNDNEWAHEVFGLHPRMASIRGFGQRRFDKDARDFLALLNCEAVLQVFHKTSLPFTRGELLAQALLVDEDPEVALPSIPKALRRLREALENPS